MQVKAPYGSRARQAQEEHPPDTHWTFLTNHAHVLRALAADADLRVRDLADTVGITERAALRILADLEEAGYIRRERVGRRTHYRLRLDQPMRHSMERALPVSARLEALEPDGS